ncbi:hypothetical protein BDR04DRAFT_1140997 [Suillus decipiens]|nr:hypothetical protein BDR04DRAFT_1140997 [Suillus decipiens]
MKTDSRSFHSSLLHGTMSLSYQLPTFLIGSLYLCCWPNDWVASARSTTARSRFYTRFIVDSRFSVGVDVIRVLGFAFVFEQLISNIFFRQHIQIDTGPWISHQKRISKAFIDRHRELLSKEHSAKIERSALLFTICGPKLLEQKGLALGSLGVVGINIGLGGKTCGVIHSLLPTAAKKSAKGKKAASAGTESSRTAEEKMKRLTNRIPSYDKGDYELAPLIQVLLEISPPSEEIPISEVKFFDESLNPSPAPGCRVSS